MANYVVAPCVCVYKYIYLYVLIFYPCFWIKIRDYINGDYRTCNPYNVPYCIEFVFINMHHDILYKLFIRSVLTGKKYIYICHLPPSHAGVSNIVRLSSVILGKTSLISGTMSRSFYRHRSASVLLFSF